MKSLLSIFFKCLVCLVVVYHATADAKRKEKPWPEINLSTVPSVVGMENSWAFEIKQRSPVYLSDLDKLYMSLSYGIGQNKNDLTQLSGNTAGRYGFRYYRGIDYSINDLHFDLYTNLSKSTFGSIWLTYGRDRDKNGDPFLTAVPSRLNLSTAFAWKVKDNVTLGLSGTFNNYPLSYVFALQPGGSSPADTQLALPSGDGQNLSGEIDFLYRTKTDLDIIVGGIFQNLQTKFEAPTRPDNPDGTPPNVRDTAIVKEFIYSGAPKFVIKKTYATGSYVRAGGSYYFNLFDYQYRGRGPWESPSIEVPSYRSQSFDNFVPKWKLYLDGTRALGTNSSLYACVETGSYPNALTRTNTDFVPLRLSLVDLDNLFSGSLTAVVSSRLTRIFYGALGIEMRYFNNGDDKSQLDNRTLYVRLKLGTTTRFYRSLWWSIRVPDFRLYTSKALGSAILFENRSYIETEVLFLGL